MTELQVLFVHPPDPCLQDVLSRLPWEEMEMAMIGCVSDADEALRVINHRHVDIMVADVNVELKQQSLIDYVAENKENILIIAIADPQKMDSVLLAMRYQTVYDFLHRPFDKEEIRKVLTGAGQYWNNWSLSVAIAQLTDMRRFKLSREQKTAIDSAINRILACAMKNQVDELSQNVETLFRDLLDTQQTKDLSLARVVAVELMIQLRFMLIGTDAESREEFALYSFMHKLLQANNGADLEDLCQNYLYHCVQILSPSPKKQMSALVRDALRITEEQYSDSNFSLISLADELGVSSNYLSSIFKMETGMRFKKYLNTFRIDKAKELLMDSRYKIYEVSDLVGIEDSRYFSQIFKTYIGMKPSEYRNSI